MVREGSGIFPFSDKGIMMYIEICGLGGIRFVCTGAQMEMAFEMDWIGGLNTVKLLALAGF